MSSDPFRGLRWKEELFGLTPGWTYEPEISSIEKTMEAIHPSTEIQVKFLTQGGFNKIYKVHINEETYIMRVSLPVQPVHKTKSEVATLDWVCRMTDTPLPKILAWDATRNSQIGFEWILMTEVPGKPLSDLWRSLSFAVKSNLVRRVAGLCASLWKNQLEMIGNIYPPGTTPEDSASTWKFTPTWQSILSCKSSSGSSGQPGGFLGSFVSPWEKRWNKSHTMHSPWRKRRDSSSTSDSNDTEPDARNHSSWIPEFMVKNQSKILPHVFTSWMGSVKPKSQTSHPAPDTADPRDNTLPNVGRIVSLGFLWGSHARQNVDAGPFHSSQDWINSRLAFARNDCEELLAKYSAEEERGGNMKRDIIQVKSTQAVISKLETLVHRLFPRTSQLPEPTVITHDDLNNHNIMVNDNGELMGILDWECVSALPLWKACYYPRFLQGPSRFSIPDIKMYEDIESESNEEGFGYFSDLREWETTILRQVFVAEMREMVPCWVDTFNSSQLQRDFDAALQYVHNGLARREIEEWLDEVLRGNPSPQSLRDQLGR